MYTTSSAFLDALVEARVDYIFANFGSDHPALLEAIAQARAAGRAIPQVVTVPNEMVALSCAHGYAQLTGRAQAVVVHVECGTQALGGAVHNAGKGRVPVLIFAGLSPATQEGELLGSRSEHIHWIQDVYDQRGIVREYMKYDNEVRTPVNVKQIVHRAMQFAHSEPRGPAYLVGAREIMEAEAPEVSIDLEQWKPLPPAALSPALVPAIAEALATAQRPLVVTSYLGRNPEAPAALAALCDRLGMAVIEPAPSYLNIAQDHPLYQGSVWNEQKQNAALAAADLVLVLDCDIPWMPKVNRPAEGARIIHIDTDPLKASMPLWYIGATQSFAADSLTALGQINAALDAQGVDAALVERRRTFWADRAAARRAEMAAREIPTRGKITAEYVVAQVRAAMDERTIILNEAITNYGVVSNHIQATRPASLFGSGAGSLGWAGGAALGMKLAQPDATVITLTGDGTYMFEEPMAVHWMARRYRAPILQIVFNNGGWKAPRNSYLAVHPDGFAAKANDMDISFDPVPDYAGIAAAAGGSWARKVEDPADFDAALAEALRVVREEGRAAVLDVVVEQL